MRQNFLAKMYDVHADRNTPTPQPQGFTLQQVSDAWDAAINYVNNGGYDDAEIDAPNRKQYLATLTPAPDVKEVAVAFADFIRFQCKEEETDLKYCAYGYFHNDKYFKDSETLFKHWYEDIYPGVIINK